VVVDPIGEVLDEQLGRLRITCIQAFQKGPHATANAIMLSFMPLEGGVTRFLHEPFFVREVVLGTGHQRFDHGFKLLGASSGLDGPMDLVTDFEEGPVLGVNFGQIDFVGSAPLKQTRHENIISYYRMGYSESVGRASAVLARGA
jgi:hypothetical protein